MKNFSRPSTTIGAGVLVVTATILRKISPNFGKLISDEAEKKGLKTFLDFMNFSVFNNISQ